MFIVAPLLGVTLYTVGSGSPRMLVVLIAFCAGGFWASLDLGA